MQDDARDDFRGARWRLLLSSTGGVPHVPLTADDISELENEAGMTPAKDRRDVPHGT